jgi:hypothetical protein
LDRYGHLFPDELDALATRLDADRTQALLPSPKRGRQSVAGHDPFDPFQGSPNVVRTAAD